MQNEKKKKNSHSEIVSPPAVFQTRDLSAAFGSRLSAPQWTWAPIILCFLLLSSLQFIRGHFSAVEFSLFQVAMPQEGKLFHIYMYM